MEITNVLTILTTLLLGGVLGMVGQAIRSIMGIRKVLDSGGTFSWSILLFSLFIGFIAGILAMLGVYGFYDTLTVSTMLGVMASGYAGADFIEGFMKTQRI